MKEALNKLDKELIKQEDMNELAEIFPSIKHDWMVKPIFRTETEARISVLNEIHFPTAHSKYWQSIREQQVHFDQLIWLSFEYRRNKIGLQRIERHIKEERDELETELLEIDKEQKLYEIALCEKIASERIREIKQWDRIKKELLEKYPSEICTENADFDVQQLKTYTKTFILEMFNSGNNIQAADAQNIIGKAITAKNRCKKIGIWKDIIKELRLTNRQLEALGERG